MEFRGYNIKMSEKEAMPPCSLLCGLDKHKVKSRKKCQKDKK